MPELVADCPRCSSKQITFDVEASKIYKQEHGWQNKYEVFSICRHCGRSTIFDLAERSGTDYNQVHRTGLLKMSGALNKYVDIRGFISLKDKATIEIPKHIPADIEAVFIEGATCLNVGCFNAAGTMFRLCIDLATKGFLPKEDSNKPHPKVQRDLGLRLPWLFNEGLLPESLREISMCIKEDGNDGAHAGTLTSEDVNDMLDFTSILLERIFTEPERVKLAEQRRIDRRIPNNPN
jgi:hypothetical protein